MQVAWIYGKSVVMKPSQYELGFESYLDRYLRIYFE